MPELEWDDIERGDTVENTTGGGSRDSPSVAGVELNATNTTVVSMRGSMLD